MTEMRVERYYRQTEIEGGESSASKSTHLRRRAALCLRGLAISALWVRSTGGVVSVGFRRRERLEG
jgi:hypothetical protein